MQEFELDADERVELDNYLQAKTEAFKTMICLCGKKAVWNYEPAGYKWGRCDDCARKPCSCNYHLKKGVVIKWGVAESGCPDIINPEEDYEFFLDTDGRHMPCCEFELIDIK